MFEPYEPVDVTKLESKDWVFLALFFGSIILYVGLFVLIGLGIKYALTLFGYSF